MTPSHPTQMDQQSEIPKSDEANLTSPVPSEDLPPARFTADQLRQYEAYERVRKSGKYNMFDPRARRATRLDADAYVFVMRNFSALRAAIALATKDQS